MTEETSKKESRKYTRRRTSDYLVVSDRESGARLGRVTDLSPRGMMLLSGESMSAESEYALTVSLPDGIFERPAIEMTAVCHWSRFEKQSEFWCNGLEITAMSDADRRLLQQVVIQLLTNNGECRELGQPKNKQGEEKIQWLRHRPYRRKEGV